MSVSCIKCGYRIDHDKATYCPNCGDIVAADRARSGKSPGLAAILSLLIPGLGQMYAGKYLRGIAFLIIEIIGLVIMSVSFITFAVWIIIFALFAAFDARRVADRGAIAAGGNIISQQVSDLPHSKSNEITMPGKSNDGSICPKCGNTKFVSAGLKKVPCPQCCPAEYEKQIAADKQKAWLFKQSQKQQQTMRDNANRMNNLSKSQVDNLDRLHKWSQSKHDRFKKF